MAELLGGKRLVKPYLFRYAFLSFFSFFFVQFKADTLVRSDMISGMEKVLWREKEKLSGKKDKSEVI